MSLLLLKGSVASHSVKHMDLTYVNSFVFRKVCNDTQITIHFKKDLDHGVYSYEFEVSSDHTSGFDVYMYGECGGSGFHEETMYRYWSSTEYNTGKDFNPRKQVKSRGGYFHRGSGKKVQFCGSFRYRHHHGSWQAVLAEYGHVSFDRQVLRVHGSKTNTRPPGDEFIDTRGKPYVCYRTGWKRNARSEGRLVLFDYEELVADGLK